MRVFVHAGQLLPRSAAAARWSKNSAYANLQMWFERCALSTRDSSSGSALRFGGVLTQLHTVINCMIDNQVHLDGCADACRFLYNTIGGNKAGFRVRLALGAFKTLIAHNVLVPRDGALVIESASQLDFLFNQCEQQASKNRGPRSAHVVIDVPAGAISRGCNISGNNFGGGSNVDHAIFVTAPENVVGVEDLIIAGNSFGLTATRIDIVIADVNVRDTQIMPGNHVRGHRGNIALDDMTGRIADNHLDGSDMLSVTDRGRGSYGVWQDGVADSANGWKIDEANPCRFRKTVDNNLQWDGVLRAGITSPGKLIATLPPGFRPRRDLQCPVATDIGPGTLSVAADGRVSTGLLPGGARTIYMAGVLHRVQGKARYNPGV